MRSRTIFGVLVPYDRVWCPGADEATTLDSDRQLQVGSLRVPPGPHTLWILPTEGAWTLIVSKEPSGFHTQYHPDADLGRVAMMKESLAAPVEQLTFAVTTTNEDSGTIDMQWERTKASVSVRVAR
jgi:hypothetical protein